MSEHEHIWHPIPLQQARYECKACGATAYRSFSGEMKIHKQNLKRTEPVNVRSNNKGFIPMEWNSNEKDPDK